MVTGNTSQTTGVQVLLYDGTSVSPLGSRIITGDIETSHDMLRASNGEIFLVTSNNDDTANDFYRFDTATNDWELITNDIADGGDVSGFAPQLLEADGFVYVTFTEFGGGTSGLTTVRYNETTLSVNDHTGGVLDVAIFPNPTNGIITVESISEVEYIAVYGITGEKLLETSAKSEIDLSSLSSGMYLVRFTSENRIITKKIIKQ